MEIATGHWDVLNKTGGECSLFKEVLPCRAACPIFFAIGYYIKCNRSNGGMGNVESEVLRKI